MSPTGAVVFVQPHFDDVALSCGGTVAALARKGVPVTIATVFSEVPATAVRSRVADELHAAWGLDPSSVAGVRRAEDDAATRVLGAGAIRLGMTEAIYRGSRYGEWAALFGTVPNEEMGLAAELVRRLAAAMAAAWPVVVVLPQAVGGHVDHRICTSAAGLAAAAGCDVWCYRDQPYAGPNVPAGGCAVDIGETLGVKLAAVNKYRSQRAALFGEDDPADVLSTWTFVGGRHVEHFWPFEAS